MLFSSLFLQIYNLYSDVHTFRKKKRQKKHEKSDVFVFLAYLCMKSIRTNK